MFGSLPIKDLYLKYKDINTKEMGKIAKKGRFNL